jgi:hypothetical protein
VGVKVKGGAQLAPGISAARCPGLGLGVAAHFLIIAIFSPVVGKHSGR